ncbi:MAG: hypothetical protein IKX47_08085, partial [Oscillospiraceae bacterium]|nr:hypothetical protein [Oscillospiraceae bacterium]
GRRSKPIHSILYSVAQPLEKGDDNYYSIIQGGAIEHLQVFPALSQTGKTKPARFATTKVPFGGFFRPFL